MLLVPIFWSEYMNVYIDISTMNGWINEWMNEWNIEEDVCLNEAQRIKDMSPDIFKVGNGFKNCISLENLLHHFSVYIIIRWWTTSNKVSLNLSRAHSWCKLYGVLGLFLRGRKKERELVLKFNWFSYDWWLR